MNCSLCKRYVRIIGQNNRGFCVGERKKPLKRYPEDKFQICLIGKGRKEFRICLTHEELLILSGAINTLNLLCKGAEIIAED